MSTALETTGIPQEIVSRPHGLEITGDLTFNEWRRFGERLLETTDRALWSLGDWRVYGERYAMDYAQALAEIDERSRLVGTAARVARSFAPERRRSPQLSFELHELVSSLPPDEQERWLDEAERQGWGRRQLQFAFAEEVERVKIPAISVRAVGELRELCLRAAEREGLDPKEWVVRVLERAAREALALPEEVAA
jgi:hypothetical protein